MDYEQGVSSVVESGSGLLIISLLVNSLPDSVFYYCSKLSLGKFIMCELGIRCVSLSQSDTWLQTQDKSLDSVI